MRHFRSPDGTAIACSVHGKGPPLLLVHGTGAGADRWRGVLPALAETFTVYLAARRGRAPSGDGPTYGLAREAEDIAAVAEGIGGEVAVVAHSFGAICALEAALLGDAIQRLVLYEPPIGLPMPPDVVARLRLLIDGGDRDEAVRVFFQEVIGMPPPTSAWPERVAAAHTLPRELEAQAAYVLEPDRLRRVAVPVVVLVGGSSPPIVRRAAREVAETLPNGRELVIPGQKHVAMDSAPAAFVEAVGNAVKPQEG